MSNPALASVRKGVTLVYAGLLTILLGIIATFVLPFLFLGIMGSADKAGPIVLSVMIGVILVGGLMMFVGQCLCMVAPTSLKPIPIVPVTIAMQLVGLVSRALPANSSAVLVIVPILSACSTSGFLLFLIFLRRVAASLSDASVQSAARRCVNLFVIVAVLSVAALLFKAQNGLLYLGIAVTMLFLALAWLGTFSRVLTGLRKEMV